MKYVSTLNMDHNTWLEHRQTGIGGSDVSSILGCNPWQTPLDVYNSKVGPVVSIEGNSRMIAGNKLENVIAEYWEEATGLKTKNDHKIRYHPEHDFLLANVDRVITVPTPDNPLHDDSVKLIEKSNWTNINKGLGILEVKTAGYHSYKNWNGAIPDYYYCQLQHYLNVTGYTWGEFAVLVDGHEFHRHSFDRDDEFIELMTRKLVDFWQHYVLAETPPPPTNDSDLKNLYPSHIPEKQINAEPNVVDLIEKLKAHKELIATTEKTKRECELELKKFMGDAEAIMFQDRALVTWRQGKARKHFDKKGLGQDQPDLLEKYTKEMPGNRTFLIK